MFRRTRNARFHRTTAALFGITIGVTCAIHARTSEDSTSASTGVQHAVGDDNRTSEGPHHIEMLLDLAFECASKLPTTNHLKDRSRAQHDVVRACLELDQLARAEHFSSQIDNWRRAAALADIAQYHASQGNAKQAGAFAEQAQKLLPAAEGWRQDRIKALLAGAYAWLGNEEQAQALEANVIEAERGKADVARAMQINEAEFTTLLHRLQNLAGGADIEQVRNALESCVRLIDRFHDNEELRREAEAVIRNNWTRLPVNIQIQLMLDLADVAINHDDRERALRFINEAQIEVERFNWLPEDIIPQFANVAAMRYRAGDKEIARRDLHAIRTQYESQREKILNFDRADVLRPLAVACLTMQDRATAIELFRTALEEGAANPNGRPRAIDLSATCWWMAVHDVEPDEAMFARIKEINEGLNQPW